MLIWELVDVYLLLDRYNFLPFFFFYLLSEPPHLSKLSKAHAKHIMYFSYKNQCLRMCFLPGLLQKFFLLLFRALITKIFIHE